MKTNVYEFRDRFIMVTRRHRWNVTGDQLTRKN